MSVTHTLSGGRVAHARSFYLVMAVLLAAIAVFGFAHTVPGDFTSPGFPALLVAHGLVFTAWVLLFVAQPSLIQARSLAWHRRLGWVGVALSVAMVALGACAILLALRGRTLPPFYPPTLFIVRGTLLLAIFAILVAAAIALRRRPGWHRRLMLCAAIVVVAPGLERAMPVPLLGPHWWYTVDAVLAALALAGPVHDAVVTRRVHPAYVWGVGAILAGQAAVDLLAPTPVARLMLRAVGAG